MKCRTLDFPVLHCFADILPGNPTLKPKMSEVQHCPVLSRAWDVPVFAGATPFLFLSMSMVTTPMGPCSVPSALTTPPTLPCSYPAQETRILPLLKTPPCPMQRLPGSMRVGVSHPPPDVKWLPPFHLLLPHSPLLSLTPEAWCPSGTLHFERWQNVPPQRPCFGIRMILR